MRVVTSPIAVRNYDEFGYMNTQRGVAVRALDSRNQTLYKKEVYQRGAYLPFRPFYSYRVKRAVKKANVAIDALKMGSNQD